MGSIPGTGRSHVSQGNWAHKPQLLSLSTANAKAHTPYSPWEKIYLPDAHEEFTEMPSSTDRDHVLGDPTQGQSTATLGMQENVSSRRSAVFISPVFTVEDASSTQYQLPHIKLAHKGIDSTSAPSTFHLLKGKSFLFFFKPFGVFQFMVIPLPGEFSGLNFISQCSMGEFQTQLVDERDTSKEPVVSYK